MVVRGQWLVTLLIASTAWVMGNQISADEVASPIPAPPEPGLSTECPDIETLRAQFKRISEVKLRLHPEARELPSDCSSVLFETTENDTTRSTAYRTVNWLPTNFFHQPLYFDDMPLERYGQSVCPHWQPVASGLRFFLTVPAVPYKIGLDRPYDCVTTLGLYRPGVCAPCVRERYPIEADATLFEAATALGFVFLLP